MMPGDDEYLEDERQVTGASTDEEARGGCPFISSVAGGGDGPAR